MLTMLYNAYSNIMGSNTRYITFTFGSTAITPATMTSEAFILKLGFMDDINTSEFGNYAWLIIQMKALGKLPRDWSHPSFVAPSERNQGFCKLSKIAEKAEPGSQAVEFFRQLLEAKIPFCLNANAWGDSGRPIFQSALLWYKDTEEKDQLLTLFLRHIPAETLKEQFLKLPKSYKNITPTDYQRNTLYSLYNGNCPRLKKLLDQKGLNSDFMDQIFKDQTDYTGQEMLDSAVMCMPDSAQTQSLSSEAGRSENKLKRKKPDVQEQNTQNQSTDLENKGSEPDAKRARPASPKLK